MTKELLISQTLSECRVALTDRGEIINFLMERREINEGYEPDVGDIYLGKVLRVLPGMQSAFVDIGGKKSAFLYVDDAYLPSVYEQRKMVQKEENDEREQKRGEIIPDELSTLTDQVNKHFSGKSVAIESFIKEGDDIVVQVAKGPIASKGPRITRHITLAGRYVVFMPYIEHIGVSQRIEGEKERERLKNILEKIRPKGMGIIARTVANGRNYKTLKQDFDMLSKIWSNIQKDVSKHKGPKQIYRDLNFIQKTLRDFIDEDVDSILVDSEDVFKEVEKFTGKFLLSMVGKVKFYGEDIPLFEKYGIDLEIERALSNKVFLRSGGLLNIDQTEALVSIDINTGKFVGHKTLEETVLKTNLEAVKEISYQLRLRNCGGIIVIDFIDMEKKEHRDQVYGALLEALKKDRAKTSVLPLSGLGLVEMTRKRTHDTLTRLTCHPCPYCEGTGRVKSALTVCYELIRELIKVIKQSPREKINIYAHPEVTAKLCGEDIDLMDSLEETYKKSFLIRSENSYHIEQYEIFTHEH